MMSTLKWYSATHQPKIWKIYLITDSITVSFLSAKYEREINLKPFEFKVSAAAKEIQQDASKGGY